VRDSGLAGQLPDLIAQIYDAVLDPRRWQAFVETLGRSFGGTCALFAQDGENTATVVSAVAGMDPSFLRSYAEHYYKTNVWIPGMKAAPSPSVLTGDQVVARAVFEKSEFYNDYWRPQGLSHAVGCVADNDEGFLSTASIIRSDRLGAFRDAELAVLQVVTAHPGTLRGPRARGSGSAPRVGRAAHRPGPG